MARGASPPQPPHPRGGPGGGAAPGPPSTAQSPPARVRVDESSSSMMSIMLSLNRRPLARHLLEMPRRHVVETMFTIVLPTATSAGRASWRRARPVSWHSPKALFQNERSEQRKHRASIAQRYAAARADAECNDRLRKLSCTSHDGHHQKANDVLFWPSVSRAARALYCKTRDSLRYHHSSGSSVVPSFSHST